MRSIILSFKCDEPKQVDAMRLGVTTQPIQAAMPENPEDLSNSRRIEVFLNTKFIIFLQSNLVLR